MAGDAGRAFLHPLLSKFSHYLAFEAVYTNSFLRCISYESYYIVVVNPFHFSIPFDASYFSFLSCLTYKNFEGEYKLTLF